MVKNTLGATSPYSIQVTTANARFDRAVSGNLTSLSVGGTSSMERSQYHDKRAADLHGCGVARSEYDLHGQ